MKVKNPYLAKRHWEIELPPLSRTDDMAKRYDDIINLSVGDPDYPADKTCIDMMYQDARVGGWNQAAPNRTPMQEVGFSFQIL